MTDPADPDGRAARPAGDAPDAHVVLVHRIGALLVAGTIGVFGLVGLAGGLGFFTTRGEPVLGLSANGLLSTLSLVTAAVLGAAAARSGRLVSTVMMIVGVLFLLSGLGHLFVLDSGFNPLAFELPNVIFSLGAGLVLLLLGSYGRVTGRIPHDNPYYLDHHRGDPDQPPSLESGPPTAADLVVDEQMAEAERASAQGYSTADQRNRVRAMARMRTPEDRRRVWTSHDDESGVGPAPGA